jgi:hypothetical protein
VKPPQLYPKVFAVCPHSLPQDAEQALAGDSAFRVVHRSCYVTVKWLDVCVRVSGQAVLVVCAVAAWHPQADAEQAVMCQHCVPVSGIGKLRSV